MPAAKARIAARQAEDDARAEYLAGTWWFNLTQEELIIMGRPRGSGNKAKATAAASQSSALLKALEFVSVVPSRSYSVASAHVSLAGKMAVKSDGILSAGHPIAEELNVCPQFERLKVALKTCGSAVTITELDSGRLRIKGDKLSALVPCFDPTDYSPVVPDAVQAAIDDRLKASLAICGSLASENGQHYTQASVCLEAWICTGTNRQVVMQHRHGIDLPPHMVLPKVFTAAVVKTPAPLSGFGFSWAADFSHVNSVTFWFEGGAWIKTQCFADRWPIEQLNSILNVTSHPVDVLPGFFEGVATVGEFADTPWVYLKDGAISSHEDIETGAQFEVKGLQGGSAYGKANVKLIAPFAKTMDLTTYREKAFFFGDDMRGCIMGVGAAGEYSHAERKPERVYPPEQPLTNESGFYVPPVDLDDEVAF
jgi:hypothetical protein